MQAIAGQHRRRTGPLTLFRFRVAVSDTVFISLIISVTSIPSALSPLTATIWSPTLNFASRSAMEPASIFEIKLFSVRWMPNFSPSLSAKSAVTPLTTPLLPSGYFSSSGVSSFPWDPRRTLLNHDIAAPTAPGSEPVSSSDHLPITGGSGWARPEQARPAAGLTYASGATMTSL